MKEKDITNRWLVIDGQQRITTITLLLLSFMRRLKSEMLDTPVSAEDVDDDYLRNRDGRREQKYKMLLTRTDKETLIAPMPDKITVLISEFLPCQMEQERL